MEKVYNWLVRIKFKDGDTITIKVPGAGPGAAMCKASEGLPHVNGDNIIQMKITRMTEVV